MVQAAAKVAGGQAQGGADNAGDEHGDERNRQRDAGAVDDAAEHVAALLVGAQYVPPGSGRLHLHAVYGTSAACPGRRLQTIPQAALERIMGRNLVGEDGGYDQYDEQNRATGKIGYCRTCAAIRRVPDMEGEGNWVGSAMLAILVLF